VRDNRADIDARERHASGGRAARHFGKCVSAGLGVEHDHRGALVCGQRRPVAGYEPGIADTRATRPSSSPSATARSLNVTEMTTACMIAPLCGWCARDRAGGEPSQARPSCCALGRPRGCEAKGPAKSTRSPRRRCGAAGWARTSCLPPHNSVNCCAPARNELGARPRSWSPPGRGRNIGCAPVPRDLCWRRRVRAA
jgi:hypothetical protein